MIPRWSIHIWCTYHSNINAWMSVTYSVLNHTHLTYTPQQWQCMNDSYYYCTLIHMHLTYTPQQYQWVNDRYHYSLWTIRIWRTHHSNMNVWMTVTFIPFWIIRIWRTHHSNINAWMTVIIIPFLLCFFTNLRFTNPWMTAIIIHFEPYASDVHSTVIWMREWLVPLFRLESYAFDVHTIVININAWMTVIIIPFSLVFFYKLKVYNVLAPVVS